MAERRTKNKKGKARQRITTLVIIVGFILACYPWISNFVNNMQADSKVSTYTQEVNEMKKDRLEKEFRKARRYNKKLAEIQTVSLLPDPFSAYGNKERIKKYNRILPFSNGVMAWLRVPSVGIKYPIYHGVGEYALEKGVGHLPGSSVPAGGKSSHAVITAHTGLSTARLFTDLDKMKKNDLLFIYVCGKTLAYKVDKIYVIEPDQTDSLLIEKGKDKVTLLTCYPYGVNTHRLCVECVRTPYHQQDKQLKDTIPADSQWMKGYLKTLCIGLILALAIVLIIKLCRKKKS